VPAVLVECDTESDMATKLQTYGLCAASVDPAVVNAILCDDALEISTFLNANLYFSSEGPYAGDQLYAEACALDACKDESAVKDFCEYYGDRAAKAKAGEPLPDIARVDTKAELAAIAVCLNELHDVDTSADANAERCTGDAPAPGFRCVEACGGSAVGAEDPKPAWEWLSPAAAKNRAEYGCPICLPAETLIATPKGDTPIRRLRTGDVVWTVDEAGQRAQARIEHADSVETPASHALKRLKLTDGRIVAASPGHPLADGRVFDLIAAGDRVGDGDVKSVELVPFGNSRTYDILPAGPTGLYWAGGVLLKSTLFDARASRRVSADAVTKEVGAPWPKLDAPAD
jgi:hypothetical protein